MTSPIKTRDPKRTRFFDRQHCSNSSLELTMAKEPWTLEREWNDKNVVLCVAFGPNGMILATAHSRNEDGEDFVNHVNHGFYADILIWDALIEKRLIMELKNAHEGWISKVTFSHDDIYMASGSEDKKIKLWNVLTGNCVLALTGHEDIVRTFVFSRTKKKQLFSGAFDNTIRIWDLEQGSCEAILQAHDGYVCSLVLCQNWLISGSYDCTVKCWNSESRACERILKDHKTAVNAVSACIDGSFFASASDDGFIFLYKREREQATFIRKITAHPLSVRSLSFSLNGILLVSGSMDKTMKIWSVEDGSLLQTVTHHKNLVRSVVFSPDGSRLASGSNDKTVVTQTKTKLCAVIKSENCEGDQSITRFFHGSQKSATEGIFSILDPRNF